MTNDSTALIHFDAARRELAVAHSVDEVKTIRDKAEALRQYVKQQGASLEMQNQCAEIKLRAERRAGELLADMEKNRGTQGQLAGRDFSGGSLVKPPEHQPPTLQDMGISKMQSHRWQLEAAVPEEVFERHIAEVKARGEELTSVGLVQLGAEVKKAAQRQEIKQQPAPILTGRYRCIVIDPPWPIQKIQRDVRPMQGDGLDYPTMSVEEMALLPVADLAEQDGCHIYLWVTHKYLPAGLQLLERWGFRYQCLMTWVKPVGFTPFSWMYSTEHVLFGRVGSLDLLRLGMRLDFQGKVREHSRKPDEFYDIVQQASPGPRLEMFAREARDGFVVWGNESDRFGIAASVAAR